MERENQAVAQTITAAIQQQLVHKKLVKTGRLLRSVETRVEHDALNLNIVTTMEAYGVILDTRIPFVEAAWQQAEPKVLQLLETAFGEMIERIIEQKLNTI